VAIQGFVNVGAAAATKLADAGLTIVAVGDSRGGVYRARGIDPAALVAHKRKTGSVVTFPAGDTLRPDQVLAVDCDVLVPAALENVITASVAPEVRARLIVEGANGPTTPQADRILAMQGVIVIPDILANAGGVTVSHFEWVQARQGLWWDADTVFASLAKTMRRAFQEVSGHAAAHHVDMRSAAYQVAVRRVVDAMRLRGGNLA
jgi:glutamate dehydrogenase/leucine dehydrogenase